MGDNDVFKMLNKKFDDILQELKNEYDSACQETHRLREKLMSWNRDEEIEAARAEASSIREHSLLVLTDAELDSLKKFRSRHYRSCGNGSTYQYELVGTGIGTVIKVRCPKCGEEEDITDFDSF